MDRLFAGLDVSTQSCKLVVVDYETKHVAHVDSLSYDEDLPQYGTKDGVIPGLGEGVSESEPKMWIEAVERLLERLRDSPLPQDAIRCISVSGQQHGLVALDHEGHLARRTSKLWNDYSTDEECRILTQLIGGPASMIEAVGNTQRPGYTASKIFHMVRHERPAYDKAATLFLVHNYINWYLTGGVRVMEPGDASGTALWNPKTRAFSNAVLNAIHPKLRRKLPDVRPSDICIGRVSPRLAERFGLDPQLKVDAGSGDNMCGAIGTGNVTPGIVTVSLGTSGTAYTFMEEPFIDPEGEIAAFCDSTGFYLPLLCVSNLANGYNEVLRLFDLSHEQFQQIVEQTPPGNKGRLLIPWYAGERTPDLPQAAPIYFGFGLGELDSASVCRAVLEGHVLNLYTGFQRLPVEVREIRLTGGLSRSEAWCQTMADVFEAEALPVEGEGAALGAALHAAWVWLKQEGEEVSLPELVGDFVVLSQKRCKRPRMEHSGVYRMLKRTFAALSRRVRGLSGEDPFELRAQMLRNEGSGSRGG